jgi:hypothetical protein
MMRVKHRCSGYGSKPSIAFCVRKSRGRKWVVSVLVKDWTFLLEVDFDYSGEDYEVRVFAYNDGDEYEILDEAEFEKRLLDFEELSRDKAVKLLDSKNVVTFENFTVPGAESVFLYLLDVWRSFTLLANPVVEH